MLSTPTLLDAPYASLQDEAESSAHFAQDCLRAPGAWAAGFLWVGRSLVAITMVALVPLFVLSLAIAFVFACVTFRRVELRRDVDRVDGPAAARANDISRMTSPVASPTVRSVLPHRHDQFAYSWN